MSLISAVSAVSGAVVGSLITANASAETQDRAFREQRADEARKIRIEAYQGFLDSADTVHEKRGVLALCVEASNKGAAGCAEPYTPAVRSIQDLIKKQDGLLAYGTAGAINLANEMLEETADLNEKTGEWVPNISTPGLRKNFYGKWRRQFQGQMCRDVNPLPRGDC